MTQSPMAHIAIVGLLLSCAFLGGYSSLYTAWNHGFLDALRACTAAGASCSSADGVLDMSHSPRIEGLPLTGIEQVDSLIRILLAFFAQGVQRCGTGFDIEATLAFAYLAAQFGAAWYVIALEGLRKGNKGTILSWTGTFGIFLQSITITVVAPIYLVIQTIISPELAVPETILADSPDLLTLPVSFAVAYMLPTIYLSMPLLGDISPEASLAAVALWQPFPLYQTALQALLRGLFGVGQKKQSQTEAYSHRRQLALLNRAYRFILALSGGIHLFVLGAIILSVHTSLLNPLSAREILAPTSLSEPPTLAVLHPPVSPLDARKIVVSFLRWDVYCACASMAIWSAYSLYKASAPTLPRLILSSVIWTLLGGPMAPTIIFLWRRDRLVLHNKPAKPSSTSPSKTTSLEQGKPLGVVTKSQ